MWPRASILTVIDMSTHSIDGHAAAVVVALTHRKASERHRVARAGAAATAILALIAAACSSSTANTASAPGITPTNVLIGSDQPLTGQAAAGYSEIGPASKAFFANVNAHGGVSGRTITYKYLDDAYDAAGSAKAVPDEQQLVSNDRVFAYFNGFGLLTHEAVVDSLNARGVPDLFVGSSCDCWNEPRQHPETFGFGTNYTLEGRLMGSYVARTFPADKIAYIYETNPIGCCQQAVSEMDKDIPPSHIVARESFTAADLLPPVLLLPQLQAARAAGAQVLVVDTLAPQAIAEVLLGDAGLGYHPAILDPFPLSADPTTVAGVIQQFSRGKASPAIENGLITQAHLPSATDGDNAWIRLFRQVHDQYEPNQPFDNMTVYGMAAAALFVQALRQAGPNPTRSSIVSAINRGAVNAGGPGLVSLGYSARNHDGYPGAQIGSIQNGSLVLSGPAYEESPAGAVTAHTLVSSTPRIG
jgi:ABC-type branched-subunit amino acid transport system substrate-binding protein